MGIWIGPIESVYLSLDGPVPVPIPILVLVFVPVSVPKHVNG